MNSTRPADSVPTGRYSVFDGDQWLATGDLATVLRAAWNHVQAQPEAVPLCFDDIQGEQVDLELRGSLTDCAQRLQQRLGLDTLDAPERAAEPVTPPAPAGRGRPRLGVVAREVTLLPRHWDWLQAQPGSASVALRRLVDEARRTHARRDERRRAQKACYLFLSTMAGHRPQYEEAIRALFAGDRSSFQMQMADWPADIRNHADRVSSAAFDVNSNTSERPS
jgi:uncharacterized protein